MHFRTAFRLLLGLVFLVQGTLVAAAPWKGGQPTAAAVHMDASDGCMKAHAAAKSGCCNPACPDMANCSLSSMAVAPMPGDALTPVAAGPAPAATLSAPVRVATFLFRPPITLNS